jgi:hypothetical protein
MKKGNLKTENSNASVLPSAISSFGTVCANCMDFDGSNNICTIRYVIHKDKTKSPMPRKSNQKGCQVFMPK